MEQIKQLKAMRDAARARLEATPDYKLSTSLDALIQDLEVSLGLVDSPEPSDTGEQADDGQEEPSPAEDQPVADASADPVESPDEEPAPEEAAPEEAAPAEVMEQETEDAVAALEKVIAGESGKPATEPEAAEEPVISTAEDGGEGEIEVELDPEIDGDELERALGDVTAAESNVYDGVSAGETSTEEDDEDAISRAIQELDADLAKSNFN